MNSITSQDQSLATSTVRHLDHLIDCQEFGDFTMIPNVLMRAFFDGFIPVAKFKLISIMLSHSSKFKIKRSYLENRFSAATLKKYISEIVEEGFVRRVKVRCPRGNVEVVYHTNRTGLWKIPTEKRESDNPIVEKGTQVDNPSLEYPTEENPTQQQPLKKNKGKENQDNQMNGDSNTRIDVPDVVSHQPLGGKVSPQVVEALQKIEGKCQFAKFVKYEPINKYLQRWADRKGLAELEAFTQWTTGELFLHENKGRGKPKFSYDFLLTRLALWENSEARKVWSGEIDFPEDFYEAAV